MLRHQTTCIAAHASHPLFEPHHSAQGLIAKAKNHEGKEVEYWGYGGDHGGFAADAQVSSVTTIPLVLHHVDMMPQTTTTAWFSSPL